MEMEKQKQKQIFCGESHVILLNANGDVYSCGSNVFGQLGLNNTKDISFPKKIGLLKDIKSVAVGSFHNLFLDKHGYCYSCGYNKYGQLGIGKRKSDHFYCGFFELPDDRRIVPTLINFKNRIKSVFCNKKNSSFFITFDKNQKVFSFGDNDAYELGLNDNRKKIYYPTLIESLNNKFITKIDGGHKVTMFFSSTTGLLYLCSNGYLKSKFNNYCFRIPVILASKIKNAKTYFHGMFNSYALTKSNELYSVGQNEFGQCGVKFVSTGYHDFIKVKIKGIKFFICGYHHCIVITKDNTMVKFGSGIYNCLNDKREIIYEPVYEKCEFMDEIVDGGAGLFYTMLLTKSGKIYSFGSNNYGQLGTKKICKSSELKLVKNFTLIPFKIHSNTMFEEKVKQFFDTKIVFNF